MKAEQKVDLNWEGLVDAVLLFAEWDEKKLGKVVPAGINLSPRSYWNLLVNLLKHFTIKFDVTWSRVCKALLIKW